ncbi:MAG TPA: S8 family serine peptidase, partial [Blastocatellia bacterium]|nr:S8 family serine peptidase [Blastocatellia bacterium]
MPRRTYAAPHDDAVPGEVVVKLLNADDLAAVAQDYGLDPTPLDRINSYTIYRLRITDGASPEVKAAALLADAQKRVVYAEENQTAEDPEGQARVIWSSGGDAGVYVGQWAPSMIRLPEAHTVSRGAGVTVAVLDTGIDFTHPMFAGRLVQGYDFVDDDNDASEVGEYGVNHGYGHGTHVAGLVALAAPEARIMPLRVLDADGVGDVWRLAKALVYALDPDGNPATDDGASVINLSLSMVRRSGLLRDVLRAVTCPKDDATTGELPCILSGGRGAVVVMAAGNNGNSVAQYPAGDSIAGSLAVGASTQADQVASFSNYGSWVAVAAPGENILSTVPGGGFGTWSGTSMAAPLVSGTAALIRSLSPRLNTTQVTQQITSKGVSYRNYIKVRVDAAAALGLGRAR